MGIIDTIKNIGSKVIKPVIKPNFAVLRKIDWSKFKIPRGPVPKPFIKPAVNPNPVDSPQALTDKIKSGYYTNIRNLAVKKD